ncbi:hypothetical protein JTB14_030498 [Gonioctena quinquepunctata]|nr:hypothetical protein JTB14_030498 [Gonioctena quinquepunctata]
MKQGLLAEESGIESVGPVKKSISDKGNESVRSETETHDGQLKEKARRAIPTKSIFKTGDVGSVKKIILDNIIKSEREATIIPHFHGSDNRPGWVALMCSNNITMQWLKSTIDDIEPWKGAELWVVG